MATELAEADFLEVELRINMRAVQGQAITRDQCTDDITEPLGRFEGCCGDLARRCRDIDKHMPAFDRSGRCDNRSWQPVCCPLAKWDLWGVDVRIGPLIGPEDLPVGDRFGPDLCSGLSHDCRALAADPIQDRTRRTRHTDRIVGSMIITVPDRRICDRRCGGDARGIDRT